MERTDAYERVKVAIGEAEMAVATQIFKRTGITKMQAIHAAGIASEEFAKAILPALKTPGEWQLIETAPRDGTLIDVWQAEYWSEHIDPMTHRRMEAGEIIKARRFTEVRWLEGGTDFYGEKRDGWAAFKHYLLAKDTVTH